MKWSERSFEELVGLWLVRRDERREIAFDRVIYFLRRRAALESGTATSKQNYEQNMLLLGQAHGEANNRVVVVEEEIIHRFPGQSLSLPDGRTVTIGTPGCRLHDRIVVAGVASTQD